MRARIGLGVALVFALSVGRAAVAQDAAGAIGALPIREVTVFKDGRAFVLREGEMPVDAAGNVVLDDLPRPLLGTFWPYGADAGARLAGVVVGRRRVAVERTALGLADLLRANVGAEASFQEVGGGKWSGKILPFPERSSAEIAATSPPGVGESEPQRGDVLVAETAEGTKALAIARIEGVTFKSPCRTTLKTEEFRNVLTLRLDRQGAQTANSRVGMVYLQNGLRWIPEYRIDVDGAGHAKVRLQATLVNDLADLDHVAVHLVVGVPRFEFADTLDPMAPASEAAQVWSRTSAGSRFHIAADNAIQTQSGNWVESDRDASSAPADASLVEGVGGAAGKEDLFVFDVKEISLRRGERMTLPVAEFDAPYADVYSVEAPASPPPEAAQQRRSGADVERAREMVRPVAMHKLRLDDASPFPITTAPALILRDGRLLGQGRTSYTAPGGRCDVSVTQAVGLRVRKDDHETGRVPNAEKWSGDSYHRVDLAGSIEIANDTDLAREIEVTRVVLGAVDYADAGGVVAMLNVFEDVDAAPPVWWNWYDWPSWWSRVNGVGRTEWKATVAPHGSVKLSYRWHYLWR